MTETTTVTVLFTDVVGSTRLRQHQGETAAHGIMTEHNEIVRLQIGQHAGQEVKTTGDSFMVAFDSARKAVECAIGVQRALHDYNHRHPAQPVKVRIGLHTGEATVELRLGKIRARLAQDLIGLAKLPVLPLKGLELGSHVAGQARSVPAVALGLLHPFVQRLRRAAYLACYRHDRRPSRRMLVLVIQHHPHRAGTDLRRKLVRCLARHGSTFSGVGASAKPGAVHIALDASHTWMLSPPLEITCETL
jgi:hypothetical protein